MAMLFNVLLYYYALSTFSQDQPLLATPGFNPAQAASQVALEFLAGYVVEYTLSVDNMFVFVVIFTFFRVPSAYQHRVLFYGILGALIFRAIFIALGAVLLSYHWVIILFGVLLIYTGIKMLSHSSESMDPSTNPLVRLTHKVMPARTSTGSTTTRMRRVSCHCRSAPESASIRRAQSPATRASAVWSHRQRCCETIRPQPAGSSSRGLAPPSVFEDIMRGYMGDAGEGLIDAEARLQERMDELEESRKVAKDKGPKADPEFVRQTDSLRLARTELQRQLELTTHPVRREQIGHAVAEIERRLAAVGTKKKK